MESWLETFARTAFRRSADTAHDLKTPLNVAVLNLELLRMRLRKTESSDDEKMLGYMGAIEGELRRLGRIFDVFFLLSVPPKSEGAPVPIDLAAIFEEAAAGAGLVLERGAPALLEAHESRIQQAAKLFFEGASKLFVAGSRSATVRQEADCYTVTVTGTVATPDLEPSKVFKFYYTDGEGSPDLSLASARLIAETYGGELNALEERDKVLLQLSFPLGAR
jgi:hypothetical protein